MYVYIYIYIYIYTSSQPARRPRIPLFPRSATRVPGLIPFLLLIIIYLLLLFLIINKGFFITSWQGGGRRPGPPSCPGACLSPPLSLSLHISHTYYSIRIHKHIYVYIYIYIMLYYYNIYIYIHILVIIYVCTSLSIIYIYIYISIQLLYIIHINIHISVMYTKLTILHNVLYVIILNLYTYTYYTIYFYISFCYIIHLHTFACQCYPFYALWSMLPFASCSFINCFTFSGRSSDMCIQHVCIQTFTYQSKYLSDPTHTHTHTLVSALIPASLKTRIPLTQAGALQSSSKTCYPPPDLVLWGPTFPCVFISRACFFGYFFVICIVLMFFYFVFLFMLNVVFADAGIDDRVDDSTAAGSTRSPWSRTARGFPAVRSAAAVVLDDLRTKNLESDFSDEVARDPGFISDHSPAHVVTMSKCSTRPRVPNSRIWLQKMAAATISWCSSFAWRARWVLAHLRVSVPSRTKHMLDKTSSSGWGQADGCGCDFRRTLLTLRLDMMSPS